MTDPNDNKTIDLFELQTIAERTIRTDNILPLSYPTECYKIKNAYKLGETHATNHFYNEEVDVNFPVHVKTWNVNPYSPMRPSVYFAWLSGFTECYGNLLREENLTGDEE